MPISMSTPPKLTALHAAPAKLSPREQQVAVWFGHDDTYAQIAAHLGLRHDTIRVHARNILRKLGVRTRHAAVARLLHDGHTANA